MAYYNYFGKTAEKGVNLVFMGTYQNSIDAKYRMIVPAKFREELGDKVVLTLGIDNCIYLYPMEQWAIFLGKLAKLPMSDPKARKFSRSFTGNAEECEIDKQGRLTIPANLRKEVGITKELTTIGCMDKIEVWAREVFEADDEDVQMSREEVAEGMIEYGI